MTASSRPFLMITVTVFAMTAMLSARRGRRARPGKPAQSTAGLAPSPDDPLPPTPDKSNASTDRDTPAWLRLLLLAELIASGVCSVWSAFDFPFQVMRTDLTATLTSDTLLVFLIVIAIDGFNPRSVTREQRWLMVWVARPTILVLLIAIIVNMLLPVPTPLSEIAAGAFPFNVSGPESVFISVGSAYILWVLAVSVFLVAVIALSRLSSRPGARIEP